MNLQLPRRWDPSQKGFVQDSPQAQIAASCALSITTFSGVMSEPRWDPSQHG